MRGGRTALGGRQPHLRPVLHRAGAHHDGVRHNVALDGQIQSRLLADVHDACAVANLDGADFYGRATLVCQGKPHAQAVAVCCSCWSINATGQPSDVRARYHLSGLQHLMQLVGTVTSAGGPLGVMSVGKQSGWAPVWLFSS